MYNNNLVQELSQKFTLQEHGLPMLMSIQRMLKQMRLVSSLRFPLYFKLNFFGKSKILC